VQVVDWIHLAENGVWEEVILNTVIKHQVPYTSEPEIYKLLKRKCVA
jgi:hypothetical protein